MRTYCSPHCRLIVRFEHSGFNTSSQTLLVRAGGGVAAAGVSSRLPSPSSCPQGNAEQAFGIQYPLWSLIAMNNLATLNLRMNLMVSNCKYYKSGKVKATKRSDKSFSILNGICSLLPSIVFYQLTFSKHKGFPRSGAPAGIQRKRYKLYRFFFFKENTFNNQNVSALGITRMTFPFQMLNYFKLSCWKPLIIQGTLLWVRTTSVGRC